MFLDDTPECVDGGRAAGMHAIQVDPADRKPAFDQAREALGHARVTERIVITGANRGLGLELARHYAARGDEVWAGCRRPAAAGELGELTDHVLDPRRRVGGLDQAVRRRRSAMLPLDVLINNAGVDGRALGVPDDERDVLQLSAEHVLDEIRINAIGPMLLTRALLDPLRKSSRPRIVNMSSTVGSMEVAATVGRDVGYVDVEGGAEHDHGQARRTAARRRHRRRRPPPRSAPHRHRARPAASSRTRDRRRPRS